MAKEEEGIQEMKRRLRALEMENRNLREKQEKQDLGKAVLTHLKNGGNATDRVLRAVEIVQRVYAEFEMRFDPQRQEETIKAVKTLKGELVSAMNYRNAAGVVHLASRGAQIALNSHPVGKVTAGVVALCANSYSFYKRADVEQIWRRIHSLLEADFKRFERLVEAIEALDAAWKANFEYSIHSASFRKLCDELKQGNQTEVLKGANAVIADDPKLQRTLVWFARDIVWKNIKLIVTSHYLYNIIDIVALFATDPNIELVVPGVYAACQVFLLVKDYFSDKSKLDEIDDGILRMQRQSRGMEELIGEG